MKRKLLLLLLPFFILLLSSPQQAKAQITGIQMDSLDLYSSGFCMTPDSATVSFMGSVTGTTVLTDSVDVYLNFGDGTDTSFKLSAYQHQGFLTGFVYHIYQFPGTFTAMLAVSYGSFSDTLYSSSITLSNTCAPLSGDLFVDANNNCIKDPGEAPIGYSTITISGGGATYYTSTDLSGHYALSLPVGISYTITPVLSNYNLNPTCPTSGAATITLTGSGQVQHFAYECSSAITDYGVYGYATNWKPGFSRPLSIVTNSNDFCGSVPATVTVNLPPELTYSHTSPYYPAPSVSGSTLTWNISSLAGMANVLSQVYLNCATTATLGDTICVTVQITTTPADANPSNDTFSVCAVVSNSYDPNDKVVSSSNSEKIGEAEPGEMLYYLINFQNTGNDTAYLVTIRDEIDNDLDLSTLEVMHSSHPMTLAINEREVIFRFEDIYLPDSNVNEPESHGFVAYRIKSYPTLSAGTQVHNTARIYFDFNEAIVTNTTLTTIVTPMSVQDLSSGELSAKVYPNPANGSLHVELSEQATFKADLYDMLGRVVRSAPGTSGSLSLKTENLPAGIYLLKLTSDGNRTMSARVLIQH